MHHSEINTKNLEQYSAIICDQTAPPIFPEKSPVILFIKQDSNQVGLQNNELAPPLTSLTLLDKLQALLQPKEVLNTATH